MEIIQLLATITPIIAAIFGAVAYLHSDIREIRKELKEEVKQQALRTDKLYEMFIDLLKSKNTP